MDFTNDERFDGLYLNVAQQTRGIDPLLDTVFSFLRRKTDFFHGPSGQSTDAAVQKVHEVLNKHVEIYKKEQDKKNQKLALQKARKQMAEEEKALKRKRKEDQKRAEAEARVQAEKIKNGEEDIIELGDDGFDISDQSSSSSNLNLNSKSESESESENISKSTPEPKPAPEAENISNIKPETSSVSSANSPQEEIKKNTDDNENDNDNAKEEEESSGLDPSTGNGGTVDGKYVWTQTLSELNINIPIPPNTRGRDLIVEIKKKKIKAALKSNPQNPIVDAPLTNSIICDDSFWTIEDGNRLVLNLQKLNQMEWWDSVCSGDPKIDVKKVQPENSRLDDLDGDTRQTVEKMMFDQRQKQMGLPTSDEQRKFDALEKFKKAHPEMDFSNAKIS